MNLILQYPANRYFDNGNTKESKETKYLFANKILLYDVHTKFDINMFNIIYVLRYIYMYNIGCTYMISSRRCGVPTQSNVLGSDAAMIMHMNCLPVLLSIG